MQVAYIDVNERQLSSLFFTRHRVVGSQVVGGHVIEGQCHCCILVAWASGRSQLAGCGQDLCGKFYNWELITYWNCKILSLGL